MAYLLDDNAMRICVRPRPWHPTKEVPFLAKDEDQPFFIGNGNFGQTKKPSGSGAVREIVEVIDNRSLDFDRKPEHHEVARFGSGGKRHKDRRYVFDHVFKMAASQEEVYENTAKPLLEGVLNGFNATVFAYGATGCGKTHTISGTQEDPGIIVRTMRDLFERIQETEDRYETHIEVSMIELYKEAIRDLLSDNFPEMPTGGLKLLENEKDRVTIADVTVRKPKTADEVMELVMKGNERRSTSFTTANSVSSRSHAVLQISVQRKSRNADVDVDKEAVFVDTSSATLSIVDLAGSERASATRNMGERMKEGAKINQSLLALSSCISALCDAQRRGARPHVPYRNSKLTRLLKFSLGGNCRTVMIVCVSPSSKDIEDTSNTLTWADRAKHVKTTVTRNVNGTHVSARQYVERIQQLSDRIKLLEAQLNQRDQESSKLRELKQEEAKRRIADLTAIATAKMQDAFEGVRDGAEQWAKWDVANLAIEKIENRRDDTDDDPDTIDAAKERAKCDAIISNYKHAFTDSRALQAKVNKGNELAIEVRKLLDETMERTFPDVDPVYVENLRLQVGVMRSQLEHANAKGCERGYRERVAKHEDALIRSAIASVRLEAVYEKFQSSITELCDNGAVDSERVRVLMGNLAAAQKPFFDEITNVHAHIQLSDAPAPAPVPTPIKGAQLRHTLSPSERTSPRVIERLRHASDKKGYVVGKLPSSPRRSVSSKLRRPSSIARSARFADQEGGELCEVRSYKPRSSQSPATQVSTDESGDWEEVPEVKPLQLPKPTAQSKLKRPLGLRPPGALPQSVSPIPLSTMPPPPAPTTDAGRKASPTKPPDVADAIPEWKKNRLAMGKYTEPSGTSPSRADASMSATPASPFSKVTIPIGIGRPSRPPSRPSSVLGELRQIPPRPPSAHGSSTLHLPTAASAARAGGGDKSMVGDGSPVAPLSSSRRLSDRHVRRKLHHGAVPYARKASLIPSPTSSPNSGSPNSTLTRPPRLRRSVSMTPGVGSTGLRPRPSVVINNGGSVGASATGGGAGAGAGTMPKWR